MSEFAEGKAKTARRGLRKISVRKFICSRFLVGVVFIFPQASQLLETRPESNAAAMSEFAEGKAKTARRGLRKISVRKFICSRFLVGVVFIFTQASLLETRPESNAAAMSEFAEGKAK
ncbi:MAG: hypothetical protein AB1637_05295 [Elusimicrobiota bacterium]